MKDTNIGLYVYIKEEGINAKVYKSIGDRGFAVTWTNKTRLNDNGMFEETNNPVVHNRYVSTDEIEIRGTRW